MAIQADYNGYVPASTTKTIHTGPGQVLSILATTTNGAAQTITLYDNTAASGDILLTINLIAYGPVIIILPLEHRLRFDTGLTVVTPATVTCHVTINSLAN
ncbi:MAG: hypothetical protein AB1894_15760 [Chloroflexota bacterium]